VSESSELISVFLHGVAAGGMLAVALCLWRSTLSRDLRIAGVLAGVSLVALYISESQPLWRAIGQPYLLLSLAYPVAGFFWLFVLTIFEDWRITPLTLAPGLLLLVSGFFLGPFTPGMSNMVWVARNGFAGLLALHAGAVIVRGWSGDLLEGRRRFRGLVLGLACLFALSEVAAGFMVRLDPKGPWLLLTIGQPYGGFIVALLGLALSMLLLQPRPAVFGATRRAEPVADSRVETADRQIIEKLQAAMAAERWRHEGLSIGALAAEIGAPEHRLRRLINQRLGYRNFADFLNAHRIEAAKARLADPAQARTNLAAIAFDLGYGSLGPFNRAFRAATGETPTAWRRHALTTASPQMEEAL
jgi:AraC-like DNA-binding protein